MEGSRRHRRFDTAAQTHVLQDKGVHATGDGIGGGLDCAVDLIFPHQSVEGQVHRYPTGMTIRHRLGQRVDGEIVGTAAGVEFLHT